MSLTGTVQWGVNKFLNLGSLAVCKAKIDIGFIVDSSGSIYDTEFWQIAEQKATKYFSENTSSYFKERLLELEYPYKISSRPSYFYDINVFRKNIENLGILSKLKNII